VKVCSAVVCVICGAHASTDDRFCHSCGARLHQCTNCDFVNRAGDRYCARCGQYLEPQSPEPVLTDMEPPKPPSGLGAAAMPWAVAAVVLAVGALLAAFIGVGSPTESGNLPKGALTVAGVDPTLGQPVTIDLSNPTRVEGAIPPGAAGADSVRLGFKVAGIDLGAATVPIVIQQDGRFVTYFRNSGGGRYLIAGDTTGEVALVEGAATLQSQTFDAHVEHRSLLTLPLIITLVGIYSLFWRVTSLLRSLRRGRRRRTGPLRLGLLGAVGGCAMVVIAWILGIHEPTVPSIVLSAAFGAAAGVCAGLSALALGDRRRWKMLAESANLDQSAQFTAATASDSGSR
jgi:double zinc ribbon protein